MNKQPHYGISAYGPEAPTGVSASGNQSPPHVASQVAHSMQIPLSYADAVIGAAGASISYMPISVGTVVQRISWQNLLPKATSKYSGSTSWSPATIWRTLQIGPWVGAGPASHNGGSYTGATNPNYGY
ncbi:hypothetical protein ABZP36_017872 [Zizania latifolia]